MRNEEKQKMQLLLPECRDMEEVVLGSMLLEKESAVTGLKELSDEMFSRSDLAFVFRGIRQTMERHGTCDFLLVVQEMMHMDSALASEIQAPFLVTSLTSMVASGGNLPFHIAVIKEKYLMHDLRDSGAIEQDADTVLFLHRPYYYSRSEADRGEMLLDLVKHRNGESREFTVKHNDTFSVFTESEC